MSMPPGASYRISNLLIIAKRRLLNLEDPVRIQSHLAWMTGNPLFDWYSRRSNQQIERLQLRKEHESPFFHEYVVFALRNQGGYFRIDRRQKPHEDVPLDSIYKDGVEAYDTIEEVTSFNDMLYSSSDCLVELEFGPHSNIDLSLLLDILLITQGHPQVRVYTLQRYNCYFFAQTILVCVAHLALVRSLPEFLRNSGSENGALQARRDFPRIIDGILCLFSSEPESQGASIPHAPAARPGRALKGRISGSRANVRIRLPAPLAKVVPDPRTNLSQMITALFSREVLASFHQCQNCFPRSWSISVDLMSEPVRLKLADIPRRVSTLLQAFWDMLLALIWANGAHNHALVQLWSFREDWYVKLLKQHYDGTHVRKLWTRFSRDVLDHFVVVLFRKLLSCYPRTICPFWQPQSHIWKRPEAILSAVQKVTVVNQWRTEMTKFFDSQFDNLDRILWETVAQRIHSQSWHYNLQQWLKVKVPRKETKAAYPLGRNETSRLDSTQMQDMTHAELQALISQFVCAHSIRVEQYKFVLKSTAPEVEADIKLAMSDIWNTINKADNGSKYTIDLSKLEREVDLFKIGRGRWRL